MEKRPGALSQRDGSPRRYRRKLSGQQPQIHLRPHSVVLPGYLCDPRRLSMRPIKKQPAFPPQSFTTWLHFWMVGALVTTVAFTHSQEAPPSNGYTVQVRLLGPVPASDRIRKEVVTRDGRNVVWRVASTSRRNSALVYAASGFPSYVHRNGLAIVLLK